jgi:hypothetical protein
LEKYEKILQCIGIALPEFNIAIFAQTSYCNKIYCYHCNVPSNAAQYVNEALSFAMHAMQAVVHSILGSSLGNLVFNRDMFLNIPLIADWHAITQRREHLIHENLM